MFKKIGIAAFFALTASVAASEPCFGPGGCISPGPVGPTEFCLPQGCSPVTYSWIDAGNGSAFAVARGIVPGTETSHEDTCVGPAPCTGPAYPVMGWAGPCTKSDRSECPDIFNQAYADVYQNALRANRAIRETTNNFK